MIYRLIMFVRHSSTTKRQLEIKNMQKEKGDNRIVTPKKNIDLLSHA